MAKTSEPDAIVAPLLRELEAARARIPPVPSRRNRADAAWRAVALSDEVERLCRRACFARDGARAEALLERARWKLRALLRGLDVG